MIKTSSKLGLEANFLIVIMDIYKELTANIRNLEIPKTFPMKSGQTHKDVRYIRHCSQCKYNGHESKR